MLKNSTNRYYVMSLVSFVCYIIVRIDYTDIFCPFDAANIQLFSHTTPFPLKNAHFCPSVSINHLGGETIHNTVQAMYGVATKGSNIDHCAVRCRDQREQHRSLRSTESRPKGATSIIAQYGVAPKGGNIVHCAVRW